jgi:hypothetical protein
MKIISHRANLNGPSVDLENNPEQISFCIEKGFDVEIDVRYYEDSDVLLLGHDEPQYDVTWNWLQDKSDNLWIHCKNIESLHKFSTLDYKYNYFWHQTDDYTLTSKNYIWAYPGKFYTKNTIVVMPEWNDIDWKDLTSDNCFGVCSDYVGEFL